MKNIFFDKESQTFSLQTKRTSYVFRVSDLGYVEHLYYGQKIKDSEIRYISNRQIYSFATTADETGRQFALSTIGREYAGFNEGDYRVPSVVIKNGDGQHGNRFAYQSHRVIKGREALPDMPHSRESDDCETLIVKTYDEQKKTALTLYYTVYPNEDIICRYQKIENKSRKPLYIEKCASLCLDMYRSDFDVVDLKGLYLYERAGVQRTPLSKGIYSVGTNFGTTSHHVNPFLALCAKNTDEDAGEAYGFNLLYSGSFLNEVEVDRLESTRVVCGINPTGMSWKLGAGKCFYSPEAIMTFTDQGLGQISRNFHDHTRNHIVNPQFAKATRPIVINSWEGVYFDVNEEYMLQFAQGAKQVGADTVVLDDGWFRPDSEGGLGDWRTTKEKFPSLKNLADKLHAQGLKFGIWIEPEMVSEDTDFYKADENCYLKTHLPAIKNRNQHVLDFTTDENVYKMYNRLVEEFDGVDIDYIKWDCNRYIAEAGTDKCDAGELYHRQILGVYKLAKMLTEKYPNVLFEGCSGGGGRFDLGMLYYFPQVWTSDNTDPYARMYIQYGTSVGYPVSSISCHFTKGVCTSGRESTYQFRYLVSSFGPYGYELDLNQVTDEQKAEMYAYTQEYKKVSSFTVDCDMYRLISPEKHEFCAYMQVKKDKSQALFTFIQLYSTGFVENFVLRLKGLDPNKRYQNEKTGEIYYGSTLMNVGFRLNKLYGGVPELNFKGKSGSGFQIIFNEVQ